MFISITFRLANMGGAVAYDSFRASLMPADLHFSEQFL
jgi:hypothetical protein